MATNNSRNMNTEKGKAVTKKTGDTVVSKNTARKTTANVAGRVASSVRTASASKRPSDKTYTVALAPAKGEAQTVVISAPGKVLEANTLKQGKIVKLKLSRSNVVGKYKLHHLPAPKTTLKLNDEKRESLLASMVLI